MISIDTDKGIINNETDGTSYRVNPLPPFLGEIIKSGGLIESLKSRGIK